MILFRYQPRGNHDAVRSGLSSEFHSQLPPPLDAFCQVYTFDFQFQHTTDKENVQEVRYPGDKVMFRRAQCGAWERVLCSESGGWELSEFLPAESYLSL